MNTGLSNRKNVHWKYIIWKKTLINLLLPIYKDDETDEDYNGETVVMLRSMPNISTSLKEIFEDVV